MDDIIASICNKNEIQSNKHINLNEQQYRSIENLQFVNNDSVGKVFNRNSTQQQIVVINPIEINNEDNASHEDQEILNYIIQTGGYNEIKGRSLWIDMDNANICKRTWQSMKEHFRKIIVPKIDLLFGLSSKDVNNIIFYTSIVKKN
ncbi:hypothetical protein HUG17_3827 [Dermatophagoides farinae]|uniref:TERF2-interacting telomeric protein 1 Myb domain-containing protein n=1 Tax=Dermatophagoides farinae TaxID=6954 RepID=A0A9D4NW36_DERFA|nr:hypothetical protein HUG17_3827 [Dermatophagoides farinae]